MREWDFLSNLDIHEKKVVSPRRKKTKARVSLGSGGARQTTQGRVPSSFPGGNTAILHRIPQRDLSRWSNLQSNQSYGRL